MLKWLREILGVQRAISYADVVLHDNEWAITSTMTDDVLEPHECDHVPTISMDTPGFFRCGCGQQIVRTVEGLTGVELVTTGVTAIHAYATGPYFHGTYSHFPNAVTAQKEPIQQATLKPELEPGVRRITLEDE